MDTNIVSLFVTGWGVLYSVSLGWSIYSLLDHYPRLIRFGSIWVRKAELKGGQKKFPFLGRMLFGWFLILILVFLSLSSLIYGAMHLSCSGWSLETPWFPLVFALYGLTVFIIPIFINRAVWGFDVLVFSKNLKEDVKKENGHIYWDKRFTLETMQKLYLRPKCTGSWVFFPSVIYVCMLSWAVSGCYPFIDEVYDPIIALLVVFLTQFPWPSYINIADNKLPSTLLPHPVISVELKKELDWVRDQLTFQSEWIKKRMNAEQGAEESNNNSSRAR